MADANLFQEFAKEALQQASKAKSEQEKLALNELALAWVNAALASDRFFGSRAGPSSSHRRCVDAANTLRCN
jgi:hypothetical protein